MAINYNTATLMTTSPTSINDIRHVLYINLESRNDRKQHVEAQLKSLKHGMQNLNIERFNAIKNENGAIGCSMSHLRCVKLAKERNWDHVLICEDDILFTNVPLFLKQLNKFLATIVNWDVVLLAGNNIPPFRVMNDACIQIGNCQTTTAYIVKNHYYDRLIDNYREGINMLMRNPTQKINYAIDRYWFPLQRQDKWFLITPLSVIQREDYSDIEQRITNYNHLMLDLDKEQFIRKMMERNKNKNIQTSQTMKQNEIIQTTQTSQKIQKYSPMHSINHIPSIHMNIKSDK
jgi:glycosyl transferase family 25